MRVGGCRSSMPSGRASDHWAEHPFLRDQPPTQAPRRAVSCPVDLAVYRTPSATMDARSRINAQNDALPPRCARATIKGRPTNGPTKATRWITPNKERTGP